jgi:hypothetical protein
LELVEQGATEAQLRRFDVIAKYTDKMRLAEERLANGKRLAGAVLAGTQEAINLDFRAKGFDVGQGPVVAKLDEIKKLQDDMLKELKGQPDMGFFDELVRKLGAV